MESPLTNNSTGSDAGFSPARGASPIEVKERFGAPGPMSRRRFLARTAKDPRPLDTRKSRPSLARDVTAVETRDGERSSPGTPWRRAVGPIDAQRASRVAAAVVVLVVIGLAFLAGSSSTGAGAATSQTATTPLLALGVFALLCGRIVYRLESPVGCSDIDAETLAIPAACAVGAVPFAAAAISSGWLGYWETLLLWSSATALVLIGRGAIRAAARTGNSHDVRETLIVGSGPQARALHQDLSRDPGRRLLGFVDSRDMTLHAFGDLAYLGSLEQLDAILMRTVVDEVVVALPIKSKYEEIQAVIRSCECAGVACTHSALLFRHTLARPRVEPRESFPAVRMLMVEDDQRLIVKRAFDLIGAIVLATFCLPLIVAVAVAVKITSPGPILFVQERYGHRKRRFRMFKFRTMVENAEALLPELEERNEATGHAFKIREDPRLTPIGSFLRRWSLDELPQLLNVLNGEMSLVGPRPMSVRDVDRFADGWLMRRFSVRPGLTCLWQVNGRSNLSFDDWMTLDLIYIDTWSTSLDLWILARTVPAVLKRSGAA